MKTRKEVREYMLAPKHCEVCNSVLPIKKKNLKCCSNKCRGLLVKTKNQHLIRFCIYCKKELKRTNKAITACSPQCRADYQFSLIKNAFYSGKQVSEHSARKILLSEHKECSICLLSEWQNSKIVLELDHIDGNCTNNVISNLRLLCPNCHSQTITSKGANKGNKNREIKHTYKNYKIYKEK